MHLRERKTSLKFPGFSLLGRMGGVPPRVKNLLIPPPHLEKSPPPQINYPPSTKQQFSRYNSIKTTFLAAVIAPAPFLF